MKTVHSETDDRLVDALDEALLRLQNGAPVDMATWSELHPELPPDGSNLLQTLRDLKLAADTWRESSQAVQSVLSPSSSTLVDGRPIPRAIGRYKIRRLVGSGAMGDVYEAFDPQLDRQVAVKVPRCERLSKHQAMFTERFLREARAAAAVRHPHICPIHDAGEIDGQPFVVMAFVAGESLESRLRRGRFEDLREATTLAIQITEALQAIHQQGIIHRDLKPGNILIDEVGQAIITDFGLAVSTVETDRLTSDGQIVGTPVYMSPEQAAAENSSLTPATDIYSFGVVFHEMLTGTVPFRGPLLELLLQIKTRVPQSPAAIRPELDETLAAIPQRAMAKSPSERYVSAAEMTRALRDWLEGQGQSRTDTNESKLSGSLHSASPATLFTAPVRGKALSTSGLTFLVLAILGITFVAIVLRSVSSKTAAATNAQGASPATLKEATSLLVPEIKQTAPAQLTGDFTITISSDPEKGPITKQRLKVEDRGAYPLRNGELVQFEANVNQPAYIYLLWVSPDGSVAPLYPWDFESSTHGFDAPLVRGGDRSTDHVVCPSSRKEGIEAGPPVGLQTFVMLARRTPLPAGVNLKGLLAKLPHGPLLSTDIASVRPQLRGVVAGRTKSLDYALFDALDTRLSPHFELVRMMTFPQVAE